MLEVDIDLADTKARLAQAGRHRRTQISSRSGRYVRAAPPRKGEHCFDLAVDATLRAAAVRRALSAQPICRPFSPEYEDFRKKIRRRPGNALIVFVVDASDSMGNLARLKAAKGAILTLLTTAYQKRYRVALVAFRHRRGQILLQPSSSIALARERLRRLPIGGTTPFADGLCSAWQLVMNERMEKNRESRAQLAHCILAG